MLRAPNSVPIRKFARASVLVLAGLLAGCGGTENNAADSGPTTVPDGPIGTLEWTSVKDATKFGLEATGGALGGKIYSFGGYFDGVYVADDRAAVYDPKGNEWSDLPKVPRAVTHVATVTNGREFILAGGNSRDGSGKRIEAIDNVQIFNIDSLTWSEYPKLPAPRAGGGMAKVGSTLHYFGGVDITRKEQKSHWTLALDDPAAGWQTASEFPYLLTHFSTSSIGSDIYVVGGLVGLNENSTQFPDAYKYDTKADTWTKIASLPNSLSHTTDATVVYNGRIFLFGGESAYNDFQRTVFVYDPKKNEWTQNTPLPFVRMAGIAGNIDGIFYYIRGSMNDGAAYKGTINY